GQKPAAGVLLPRVSWEGSRPRASTVGVVRWPTLEPTRRKWALPVALGMASREARRPKPDRGSRINATAGRTLAGDEFPPIGRAAVTGACRTPRSALVLTGSVSGSRRTCVEGATVQETGLRNASCGAERFGFKGLEAVHWNLTAPVLYEHAITAGEAAVVEGGALCAQTGAPTSRPPKEKHTVVDPATAGPGWRGVNGKIKRNA